MHELTSMLLDAFDAPEARTVRLKPDTTTVRLKPDTTYERHYLRDTLNGNRVPPTARASRPPRIGSP